MNRKLALALLLCVVFGGLVAAAEAPVVGKIVAVEGDKVQLALEGAKPDWIEVEANVKFKEGIGKIVAVSAPTVTPLVITVKTSKASTMKVGTSLSFEKGKAPRSGC